MTTRSLLAVSADERFACDVCIIGSGPAGATIARELAGTTLSVLLLESGDAKVMGTQQALSEIENVGAPRTLDQAIVRSRLLGGTSHLWTGRCAALDEIDYTCRPWVPRSGWPITRDAMAPFVSRAAVHLGLGDATPAEVAARIFRGQPFPLEADMLLPFFWQYSRDTDRPQEPMRFGPRIRLETLPNLRVLTHATAVHIDTNDTASAVRAVEVAAPDDRRRTINARAVVLCAGGIENARLLLASRRVAAAGLGNARDMVGRFLMDHPRGGLGRFDHRKACGLDPVFGFHSLRTSRGRHLFCQGLHLAPTLQEREGLLNCAVWLSELVARDDPWSAAKRIARREGNLWRDAATVLSRGPAVAKGLSRNFLTGRGARRKLDGLELNGIVEQCPDPDSRITLAERVDRHCVPLSRVHWRINEQEQRTIRRAALLTATALHRSGLPALMPADWVRDDAPFPSSFKDVAHHIGTTRMSSHPAGGVVDPDCEVHGVRDLFVAGSSVFPTSGHANPTQMIVTLAVRLADTLKRRVVPGH